MTAVLALAAGFAAGAAHLGVLWWRARLVARVRVRAAAALAPVGLVVPAAVAAGLLRADPGLLWPLLGGLLLARPVLMKPLARRMEEGPCTT